ncbi:fimbrial protein [Enterobacter vonholyi]|uniref:fimbrial protein n=1 Tax=Enterobacter vonholyi TaxID=2797505 RepID=UPI00209A98B0|nr:fimbrial protein [Enterobacter vonholyi]MCL5636279.1 fimbrial protein [Enterobacter vonholyi]
MNQFFKIFSNYLHICKPSIVNKNSVIAIILFIPQLVYALTALESVPIKFHGEVFAATCDIKGIADQTVTLGDVSTIDLAEAGDVSRAIPFSITVTCPDGGPKKAVVTFSGTAASDPSLLELDSVTGAATGVAVRINQGDTTNELKLDNPSEAIALIAGDNLLSFNAQYQALVSRPQITPGVANATAQFTVTYP